MTSVEQAPAGREPCLILGLGNPGGRYRATRHNLGFRVVEELARRRGVMPGRLECNALVAEDHQVTLAMPQTYMNRSGYAARCLVERRGLATERLLVVFDEVYLPLGRLRLRQRGGPGGHRGLESIVRSLQTEEIPRLRLGVADPEEQLDGEELVDFVLSPFAAAEFETVEEMVSRAADACECWVAEGAEATMNRFNG